VYINSPSLSVVIMPRCLDHFEKKKKNTFHESNCTSKSIYNWKQKQESL